MSSALHNFIPVTGIFCDMNTEVPAMLGCGPLKFTCQELDFQCNIVEKWGDFKITEALTS